MMMSTLPTINLTGQRASIEMNILSKTHFDALGVRKDADGSRVEDVLIALAVRICQSTETYADDAVAREEFPLHEFRATYMAGKFIVTTDEAFIPVIKTFQDLRVLVKSDKASGTSAYYMLAAGASNFEAVGKERKSASMMWAHVTIQAGSNESDETVIQAIRHAFPGAGFVVQDVKPLTGTLGQSIGKFHVDFAVDTDTFINPPGLRALKNIQLPSGTYAYTMLSREFLSEFKIPGCCFAFQRPDGKMKATYCNCSQKKSAPRVGDKRTNQNNAIQRLLAKQRTA